MKRRLNMLFSLLLAMSLLVGTEVAAFADTIVLGRNDTIYLEELPQGTVLDVHDVGYPFAVFIKRKNSEYFHCDEDGIT